MEKNKSKQAEDGARGGMPGAFWALALAQAVSLFGNSALRFALPLHVLTLTGSSAAMGAVTACAWVPYLFLAPVGGVIADRARKRLVMASLDVVMATTCAAFLLLLGKVDVAVLSVAVLVVLYAVQGVYQPTVQASVPSLVPRSSIQRATAVTSQVSMLSSLVGPVLGGLALGFAGIGAVAGASAALFLLSTALVASAVRVPFAPLPRTSGAVRTAAGDLADAFRFLREGRPVILRTILLATAFNLVMSSFVVIGTPVVVTQVLGLSSQMMGLAEGAIALGGLVGGAAAGALAGRLPLKTSPAVLAAGSVCLLAMAAGALPVGAGAAYAVLVAGLFLTMACCSLFSVQAVAFVQGETPAHLIGKVMAFVMALSNCATPLGALAYGWLLDAFRDALPVIVVCVVALSLLLAAGVRTVLARGLEEAER